MTGISDHEFAVNGRYTWSLLRPGFPVIGIKVFQSPLRTYVSDKVEIHDETQIPESKPTESTSPFNTLPTDSNEDGIFSTEELTAVFERFKLEYPQDTRRTNDNSYRSLKLGTS